MSVLLPEEVLDHYGMTRESAFEDSLRYSLKDTAPADPASLPELDSETLSILEEGLRVLGARR